MSELCGTDQFILLSPTYKSTPSLPLWK